MVGGRKFRRKTFRLRRRCRLPSQLAGCCWNMRQAPRLGCLTSNGPEYSSLRQPQIKWCITHVIPSQMIEWYNTCSLRDGKNASVYLIDWIPTSPDVFHWSWLMSPYTRHAWHASIVIHANNNKPVCLVHVCVCHQAKCTTSCSQYVPDMTFITRKVAPFSLITLHKKSLISPL